MKTLQISDKDFQTLKSLIKQFKEIDGDEDKPLELEDFYDLVDIGRNLNSILEQTLK